MNISGENNISKNNDIQKTVFKVVEGYIAALNQRDVSGLETYLHFPHTRIMFEGGLMRWNSANEYLESFQTRLKADKWHSTKLISVETDVISLKKCHSLIWFKRLRQNGDMINTYQSLYVITQIEENWGILLGSGTG